MAFTALVIFQFITVLVLLYLIQHIRRVQDYRGSVPGIERFSTGWMTLGITLGLLESSIGFAGTHYIVLILRKIVLAGSRAMLMYSLIKLVCILLLASLISISCL